MEESSSEMSAKEMKAMNLEGKLDLASSAEKSLEKSSPENAGAAGLQETPGQTASSEEKSGEAASSEEKHDQADTAGKAEDASMAGQTEEPNANLTSKFMDKDPLHLIPYIEKYVTIQLERNYSYVGFVHSIDPISHSIILSVPKEGGRFQTTFIPGTSVLDIKETPCASSITPPKRKIIGLPTDAVQLRKIKIISWLKENRLPVTEDGENVVFSGITLLPPYGNKDICTTNAIIALEIQKIIGRMPDDYQPK